LKRTRRKKVLGLAVGERSLLAAEVVGAGEQPQVTAVGELMYPEGVSVTSTEELAKLLSAFLREHGFTARQAVIGLPAKWLVVRPKEVPPADAQTVTEMLRLSAESEFPTDIKDLVYDFAGSVGDAQAKSVLMMATPRKYVDAAVALCDAARLQPVAVTSSAVALGEATGRTMAKDPLVLAVSPAGAEMTVQTGAASSAIRHLRGPDPQPPFVSELRRAMLTVANGHAGRELILWDGAGIDAAHLGENLGITVRAGDLPALGVQAPATSTNGTGRKYAAAVALGLAGVGLGDESVDFLHPRLAAPKEQRIPRWAITGGLAVLVLLAICAYAYVDLQAQRTKLADLQAKYDSQKTQLSTAEAFVSKVSFAQAWHGGNPRYLACLQDLTTAVPEDLQTYMTSVVIHDAPKPQQNSGSAKPKVAPPSEVRPLTVQIFGKTENQERINLLLGRLQHAPTFTDVRLGNSSANARERNWAFTITMNYVPPKAAPGRGGTAALGCVPPAGGNALSAFRPQPRASVPRDKPPAQ
jgi:Tfp pilus assembly protein PilN